MKIHVTQEDIDNGKRGDAYGCPIALALHRSFKRKWSVGLTCAKNTNGKVIEIPRSAQRFIRTFDNRKPAKPFNFILK